jgi:hypothetical protein
MMLLAVGSPQDPPLSLRLRLWTVLCLQADNLHLAHFKVRCPGEGRCQLNLLAVGSPQDPLPNLPL